MIVIKNDINTTQQWYGIQIDTNNSDSITAVSRIGCPILHNLLPIQNGMKGCLLLDNGTVNYYLNPLDWTKRADGTASDLTGAHGQVMIELPSYYESFETVGQYQLAKISEYPLPGFSPVPQYYVSAYEASLQRSTGKLSSVKNPTADFRGGNNTATWDASSNTLLGRPVTNITRTQFRTYARNRGSARWNCMTYDAYRTLFWLYYIERGDLHSQDTINSNRTGSGYRQGGLGTGVTDLDGTKWNNFNGYNPFVPCGHSDSLGNGSGQVPYTMPSEYDAVAKTTQVIRYRGVENPFGHIWKNLDGVNMEVQDASGGLSKLWVATDPSVFNDSNYTGYELKSSSCSRVDNYVRQIVFGNKGDIVSSSSAVGNPATYYRDYYYGGILPVSGVSLRALFSGGHAHFGGRAGLVFLYSYDSPGLAYPNVGSRLCYY